MAKAVRNLRLVSILLLLSAAFISAAVWQISRINADRQRTACAANLRSLGQAIHGYGSAFKAFPLNGSGIRGYMRGQGVPMDCSIQSPVNLSKFVGVIDCPCGGNTREQIEQLVDWNVASDYVYLAAFTRPKDLQPYTILAYEPVSNHGDGANFLHADGSVKWLAADEAKLLIAALDDGTSRQAPKSSNAMSLAQRNERGWKAMAGPCVVLMRHTETGGGTGDPPEFKLDDRATQRNLNDLGRAHAMAIARQFADRRITFDQVHTSPWFRCQDTAELAGGTFAISNDLGAKTDIKAATKAIHAFHNTAVTNNQKILLVTHATLIRKITGYEPSPGEMVIVKDSKFYGTEVVGTVLENDWKARPVPAR